MSIWPKAVLTLSGIGLKLYWLDRLHGLAYGGGWGFVGARGRGGGREGRTPAAVLLGVELSVET